MRCQIHLPSSDANTTEESKIFDIFEIFLILYRPVHFMRKGEATRQRIIESARELTHSHGMNVVSIGDVLRASGSGKSQFYSHFESRDELIRNVLESNEKRICDALSRPLSSWEDLRDWILLHVDFQGQYDFERGCPIGTAACALQPDQEAERKPLRKILDKMRSRLVSFLRDEKRRGRLKLSASPDKLANFAVSTIQGALMIGLVEKDGKSVRRALEECFAHLESFKK